VTAQQLTNKQRHIALSQLLEASEICANLVSQVQAQALADSSA
jgi:hypothetical protein